jgi:pyridinium-3,5-biscarboxylic acid mononucleotide sulfurtransferase
VAPNANRNPGRPMTKTVDHAPLERLRLIVRDLESAVVAFSGGVDSTLLARVVHDELADRCVAVTATSDLHPAGEADHAHELAGLIGIRHIVVATPALELPGLADNPPDRCYICKKALLERLARLARDLGFKHVVEGTNADDDKGYRPGLKAVSELGVRSPLREAGLTKSMIRAISKDLGLPTWDAPPSPCLATRFPYGERMTLEKLRRVSRAEDYLRTLGLRQFRVRIHGDIARIEAESPDLATLAHEKTRTELVRVFKELGFHYVTLDLEGYRSGAMDETLHTK